MGAEILECIDGCRLAQTGLGAVDTHLFLAAPRLDTTPVRTYPVCMNITLSISEELAERARAVAAGRGKSLNQLVRDLLEAETGRLDGGSRVAALDALWESSAGNSNGKRIRREDAYDR